MGMDLRNSVAVKLALMAAVAALHTCLCGFVLEDPRGATLPATPDNPTINFIWTGDAPPITDKDTFANGAYANLNDHDFMQLVLYMAVGTWNAVPGSFLRLAVSEDHSAIADPLDLKNSIVVDNLTSSSEAGYANPQMPTDNGFDGRTIADCDITLGRSSITASYLLYAMTHELGHCIGLGHAHTNYGAIMGYSRSGNSAALGLDDMAGIDYLYPQPAEAGTNKRELISAKSCGVIGDGTGLAAMLALIVLVLPVFVPLLQRRH